VADAAGVSQGRVSQIIRSAPSKAHPQVRLQLSAGTSPEAAAARIRARAAPVPAIWRHLNAGQRAVRDLLQPAAKERQGERTDLKPKTPDITADRR
jgi:hypothetical protein